MATERTADGSIERYEAEAAASAEAVQLAAASRAKRAAGPNDGSESGTFTDDEGSDMEDDYFVVVHRGRTDVSCIRLVASPSSFPAPDRTRRYVTMRPRVVRLRFAV